MKTLILYAAGAVVLAAGGRAEALCEEARRAVRSGDWKQAEERYLEAIRECSACGVEEKLILRADLANVMVHSGTPEGAAAQWRRALLEIGKEPRLRAVAESGLAVALFTAGHRAEAVRYWRQACAQLDGFEVEQAACRFNLAVADIESGGAWTELEELLPRLLRVEDAMTRVTALLQTARAAALAKADGRARTLSEQAEAVVRGELSARHPLLDMVYSVKAEIAEMRGAAKEAKQWRRKVRKEWDAGRVSVEELSRKPR